MTDPLIPRTKDGGLQMCRRCQRRMIFAGGLLLLLADAVDGTRLTWRQKTWATGHGEDGAALPPSIMTEDAVRAIRASTEENSILAERYDRSAKQIRNIRARKAWKNV